MIDTNLSIIEDLSKDKTNRLIIKGPVSSSNASILQHKLDETLKEGYKRIILNMREVSFLASGGIRVLLMYYKIANGRGSSFFIEDPSENVKNVLGMIALDEMLLKSYI